MIKKHLFEYSNDNKRYYTYSYYLKQTYQQKVFRIPLDAGFTCPNRDGHSAYGGCSFCSIDGSGDSILGNNLEEQIENGFHTMRNKWPEGLALAYFQAYTNTYAPLPVLKQLYDPFITDNRFVGIVIATRADCLDDDTIDYLSQLNQIKPVWIEIGLQSVHETTTRYINRGHNTQIVNEVVHKLKEKNLLVCLHIINGLPYETKEMMIETIKYCAQLKINGIKIHMYHLIKNTLEAYRYSKKPYPILSRDEYVDIVVDQLGYLHKECVVMRLTGDGLIDNLIEPQWTTNKTIVLNEIDKKMKRENRIQGDKYEKHQ